MKFPPTPPLNTHLGFHYFPDTQHYRASDLETWLPELKALGASWVSLSAPANRAIPEGFLRGLIEAGIEPILQFNLPLEPSPSDPDYQPDSFQLIFNSYAQWGIHYSILFDRPNSRPSWPASAWGQADLVERFLDRFLPLADMVQKSGLTTVFPPLEPGGDYWDTAFLRAALDGIQRRGYNDLLQSLVLGAYAHTEKRPLSWGSGGPERWPGARPYRVIPAGEDQCGFYIFDWYLAAAQAALGSPLPILLFEAGKFPAACLDNQPALEVAQKEERLFLEEQSHSRRSLAVAQLLTATRQVVPGDYIETEEGPAEPVSPYVLACNFWLLAAAEESPLITQAWFGSDGDNLPVVEALRSWMRSNASGTELAAETVSLST